MNLVETAQNYCDEYLQNSIVELEEKRKSFIKWAIVINALGIVLLFALALCIYYNTVILLLIFPFIMLPWVYTRTYIDNRYNKKLKPAIDKLTYEQLLPALGEFMYVNYPQKMTSSLEESLLFTHRSSISPKLETKEYGCIRGTMNSNQILFTELDVYNKTTARFNGYTRRGGAFLFRGIFTVFDIQNGINGKVIITPKNRIKRFFLTCFYSFFMESKDSLTNNSVFENLFDIFASSEDTAQTLLSPVNKKKILDLSSRLKKPLEISYIDSKLFIKSNGIFLHPRSVFSPVLKTVEKEDCLTILELASDLSQSVSLSGYLESIPEASTIKCRKLSDILSAQANQLIFDVLVMLLIIAGFIGGLYLLATFGTNL